MNPRDAATPGKFGQPDGDRGILLVRDVVGDRDRLEPARLRKLAVDPVDLVGRADRSGPRARRRPSAPSTSCCGMMSTRKLDRLIAIGLPLRSMIQPRRGGTGISWTRLLSRQQLVFLVLGDREPAHAADQQAADRRLGAAEQHHPPREGDRLVRGGEPRSCFIARASSASIRDTIQATSGKDADRDDQRRDHAA